MDNHGIHKEAYGLIEDKGHFILYNPSYSSDLNPIEHVFHIFKSRVEDFTDDATKDNILTNCSTIDLLRYLMELPNL